MSTEHVHVPDECNPRMCRKCEKLKWGCEFYQYRKICKTCHLDNNRAWRAEQVGSDFGLTFQEYEDLLEAQNGLCAICKEKCLSGRRLAVDHDHVTGKVRGLLCLNCNTLLGKAHDDIDLLKRAVEYLQGGKS